ncbi:hypothetical protein ABK040_010131 [Willaertia magna]
MLKSKANSILLNPNQSSLTKYGCIHNNTFHSFEQVIDSNTNAVTYQLIIPSININHHSFSIFILNPNMVIPNTTSLIYLNKENYLGNLNINNKSLQFEYFYLPYLIITIKEMNTIIFNSLKFEKDKNIENLNEIKNLIYENLNLNKINFFLKNKEIDLNEFDLIKKLKEENLNIKNNQFQRFKAILNIQIKDLNDKIYFKLKNLNLPKTDKEEVLLKWANDFLIYLENEIIFKFFNLYESVNILKNYINKEINDISKFKSNIILLLELIQDKALDKITKIEIVNERKELNLKIKNYLFIFQN